MTGLTQALCHGSVGRGMISYRAYKISDRDWVRVAQQRHYSAVEGFDASFDDAVAAALDLLEADMGDRRNLYTIVESEDGPAGCAFFRAQTASLGRIQLVYLEARYRGYGVGKALVRRIVDHAGAAGFAKVLVSSYDQHEAACAMYRSFGFEERLFAPERAFGRVMRRVDFSLSLCSPISRNSE